MEPWLLMEDNVLYQHYVNEGLAMVDQGSI